LPSAGPQRSAALAAANLAVLHLKLGDKAAVETLLDHGLNFAEAIAPPGPPVTELVKRLDANARELEGELDKALNLKGERTKTYQALNRFRAQLRVLSIESEKRQQFERELIRDVAYRGEPGLAWTLVQKRDALSPERRPMLSATPLAWYIAFTAVAIKDNATAEAIGKTKLGEKDKIDEVINAIVFNMKEGKFTAALNELKSLYRVTTYDRDRLDIAVLRRVSQYHTQQKSPEKVFELLVRELPDPQVQEAAAYLTMARAVVEGKGPEIYKLTSPERVQRGMKAGLRAALARGYVAGAQAAPGPKAAVAKDQVK
jgi:hypothetical protein